MQKSLKYTIFKTKWGYFGLAGTEYALYRTCLPLSESEKVKSQLRKNLSLLNHKSSIKYPVSSIQFDKNLFGPLQEQITAYFEGAYVDFSQAVGIVLNGFSPFSSSVLCACRRIRFGQVVTYSALAQEIGRPTAVRAVGGALAKNPLPLIIPCHRVIRSDGKIGGFSAPGVKNLKAKLLKLERRVLGR
ncbi:MAG: methylated-DNA--[protein]-cysteine S-methyltransferase [Sedimentisphaerales bacterium]